MKVVLLLLVIFLVLVLLIKIFEPRSSRKFISVRLINRTSLAFMIVILVFLIAFIYLYFLSNHLSQSLLKEIIDMFAFMPFFLPFAIGFTESTSLAYLSLIIEIVFLTFLVRLMISDKLTERIRKVGRNNSA